MTDVTMSRSIAPATFAEAGSGARSVAGRPPVRGLLVVGWSVLILCCVASRSLGPIECRAAPISLVFGSDMNGTMDVSSGTPCHIALRPVAASITAFDINRPPEFGSLRQQGRTGLIYQSNPGFKGEDAFAVALQGRSRLSGGTSAVTVRVTVR